MDLSYNKLTKLPRSFNKLLNLRYWDLRCNNLILLDEINKEFINLKTLYIEDNPIENLTNDILNLPNLYTDELRDKYYFDEKYYFYDPFLASRYNSVRKN